MSSPILSISHNDVDGYGSQYILNIMIFTQTKIENVNLNYGEVEDFIRNLDFSKYSKVYITDLNISNELCEFINSKTDNVVLIDHHMCDERNLENDWYILDKSISACLGTYNYFSKIQGEMITLRHFAEFVSVYDTWIQSDSRFQKATVLSDVVYNCPLHYNKRDFLFDVFFMFAFKGFVSLDIKNLEVSILEFIHSLSDEEIPSKQKLILSEFDMFKNDIEFIENIGITYIPSSNFQYLSSKFVDENPDKILVNYNEVKGVGSVRSRNDKAVEVAKFLGGGGHANAAGFTFKDGVDELKNKIRGFQNGN